MRREDGRAGCIRSLLWSRGRAIHLVRQGAGGFNIEVTNCDIKSFERVTRKYGVDFARKKDTTKTIRTTNDRLSREHGLFVIEKPKERGKHYTEWASGRRGANWKDKLRRTIDRVLPTVSSYKEFLAAMCQEGYEIKTSRNIGARPTWTRF